MSKQPKPIASASGGVVASDAKSAPTAASATATATAAASTELCDSETGEPFHVTFSLKTERKEAVDFFNANGYVAIRDVLSPAECDATVAEIGADMRARSEGGNSFDIKDVKTYDKAPITSRYGMFTSVPLFTDQLVHNRQHANVYDAVSLLYSGGDASKVEPLIMNHDSCCFYRPTKPTGMPPQPTWITGDGKDMRELHLDFHPQGFLDEKYVKAKRDALTYESLRDFLGDNNFYVKSDGPQLAAVLNLMDNRIDDGGFHCVPGFTGVFDEWVKKFVPATTDTTAAATDAKSKPAASAASKSKSKSTIAPTASGSTGTAAAPPEVGSYHFSDSDKTDKKFLGPLPIARVNVPKGALIIWDQRMAHGSEPNRSDRPRMRLAARKKVLTKVLTETGYLTRFGLTEIGKQLFGW